MGTAFDAKESLLRSIEVRCVHQKPLRCSSHVEIDIDLAVRRLALIWAEWVEGYSSNDLGHHKSCKAIPTQAQQYRHALTP